MTKKEEEIYAIACKKDKTKLDLVMLEKWKWNQLPSFYRKDRSNQRGFNEKIKAIIQEKGTEMGHKRDNPLPWEPDYLKQLTQSKDM